MKKNFKKSKKKKSTLKKILLLGLFFCCLAALSYFLIWSPYFWIQQIQVKSPADPAYFQPEDVRRVAENVLEEKIQGLIPLKSIFLVKKKKISNKVYQEFPGVESVGVKIEFPNSLKIEIKQRQKVGIWCQSEYEVIRPEQEVDLATSTAVSTEISEDEEDKVEEIKQRKIIKCFEIDRQGIIFNQSPLVRGEMILNIYSQEDEVWLVKQVLASDLINFILTLYREIGKIKTADNNKLAVSEFDVFSVEDIRAETGFGWKIYFNPVDSLDSQLNALERVLQEEIDKNYLDLEYMDLRIKGRVYYK